MACSDEELDTVEHKYGVLYDNKSLSSERHKAKCLERCSRRAWP